MAGRDLIGTVSTLIAVLTGSRVRHKAPRTGGKAVRRHLLGWSAATLRRLVLPFLLAGALVATSTPAAAAFALQSSPLRFLYARLVAPEIHSVFALYDPAASMETRFRVKWANQSTSTHSDLFHRLKQLSETDGYGTYTLLDDAEETQERHVVFEIENLIRDGFSLDIGFFEDRTYITCGSYKLPVGVGFVNLRHGGTFLAPEFYYIQMKINASCNVVSAVGTAGPPARL